MLKKHLEIFTHLKKNLKKFQNSYNFFKQGLHIYLSKYLIKIDLKNVKYVIYNGKPKS